MWNSIQIVFKNYLNHLLILKFYESLLCEFEVCECIKDEYYPPLLQYFDGKRNTII